MNKKKYIIFILLSICVAFASCIDDSIVADENSDKVPEDIGNGYSLNLTVTLDKMGGTRADAAAELEYWENYIDPEKFRVLFFDKDDKFLFESKSRFIKQLAPKGDYSQWLVSVPMFDYGNDVSYNWPWDKIRKALTSESFKIAILANRPAQEWYPGFSFTFGQEYEIDFTKAQWIDNSGPEWTAENNRWAADDLTGDEKTAAEKKIKSVFDLHHCQYDILYLAKGGEKIGANSDKQGYYDFIMGDWGTARPTMGAVCSWVYWGDSGAENTDEKGGNNSQENAFGVYPQDYDRNFPFNTKVRYSIRPSAEHPIPMYGIQEFEAIKDWVKGTPFNLSQITTNGNQADYKYKNIALLRSVVKLELKLSKDRFKGDIPPFVTLWYSNIYSRCEPMDVWTPTDQIWIKEHKEPDADGRWCDWKYIMDYGLVSSTISNHIGNTDRSNIKSTGNQDKFYTDYQKTLSWFYGSWIEKGWNFNGLLTQEEVDKINNGEWKYNSNSRVVIYTGDGVNNDNYDIPPYPRIFNPCIQRNKVVICNGKRMDDKEEGGNVTHLYGDDGYWHFVVYTGERNMIDPNTLPNTGNGNNYAVSWMIRDYTNLPFNSVNQDSYCYYTIPIADYTDENKNNIARNCFKRAYSANEFTSGSHNNLPSIGGGMQGDGMIRYANDIAEKNDIDEMPWPLLRNHVYTITIDGKSGTRSNNDGLSIRSKESHSERLTP